ncbi:1-acyl-sn-glycerol-3-phosphate acyltransferase, partial [Micromonospora sp. ATA32]|nr:1-acyl-sn-glycerol-3-phosphate acyltransferase [Micromonospora sp. ATA32]
MDTTPWQPPALWRAAQLLARLIVGALARLEVSGDVPAHLRRGPLILAANHISPFDPVVLAAACRARGVAPRIMATGGLFRAPVIGAAMRHAGHIRVDRGTVAVHRALGDAAAAVAAGSVVLVYPEGASARPCATPGHIRVDRGTVAVHRALGDAAAAVAAGSVVLVYP